MTNSTSLGPLALVACAFSCAFYVACGDDDVITGLPSGGSGGTPDSGIGQGGTSGGDADGGPSGGGGVTIPDAGGDATPSDSGFGGLLPDSGDGGPTDASSEFDGGATSNG